MNRITFPLTPRMRHASVADLHEALGRVGFQVSDSEAQAQEFGPSTEASVRRFQAAHALPVTGVVDQAMADALNSLVLGRGSDGRDADGAGPFVVEGSVGSRTGAGLGGLRVQIVDKNVGADRPIKEVMTDERGRYRVTFTLAEAGKRSPDLQARAYSGQTLIGV